MFIALAIPIAILIAGFAILEDGSNRMRSRAEVLREGHMITRAVQIATANALRDRQPSDVRGLIDDISGHESILAVRLFDRDGALSYAPHGADRAPQPAADAIRGVLDRQEIRRERTTVAGREVIGWLAPLNDPQGLPLGAVQVLQDESFVREDAAASSRAILTFAALLVLAVALTVGFATRATVVQPIEALSATVRRIGDGDWKARVTVRRRDELGRLGLEFNALGRRLEQMQSRLFAEQEERRRIEADLREAERLASLGRFAAGVAHEIGTPLNVISGRAEKLMRERTADPAIERGLRIINGQIERISRIVRGVLDFARAHELHIAPTDLRTTLDAVIELAEERFQASRIAVEVAVPEGIPPLAADPDQLQQVFLNLALNAADAMPAGGILRVSARLGERADPHHGAVARPCVAVAFEDTGTGIATEHVEHVLEPFFTTKEVGAGTGLGLAISYGIVREHGGWIEVESTPGRGSRITVCLPLGSPARRAATPGMEEVA